MKYKVSWAKVKMEFNDSKGEVKFVEPIEVKGANCNIFSYHEGGFWTWSVCVPRCGP